MMELTEKGMAMVNAVDYVRTSNKNGVDVDQFDKAFIATVEYAPEKFVESIIEFVPRNPEFYGDEKDRYKTAIANINIYREEHNLDKKKVEQVSNVVNISDYRQAMPENTIQMPQQINNQKVVDISGYTNAIPSQDIPVAVGENLGGRTR